MHNACNLAWECSGLEWWNSGMVDWIVFFFVFSLFNAMCLPCDVYTYASHVHTHNSTWLMVLCTDGCIEILRLNKASTGVKFTKEYNTSNTVYAFVYPRRNSTIHCILQFTLGIYIYYYYINYEIIFFIIWLCNCFTSLGTGGRCHNLN